MSGDRRRTLRIARTFSGFSFLAFAMALPFQDALADRRRRGVNPKLSSVSSTRRKSSRIQSSPKRGSPKKTSKKPPSIVKGLRDQRVNAVLLAKKPPEKLKKAIVQASQSFREKIKELKPQMKALNETEGKNNPVKVALMEATVRAAEAYKVLVEALTRELAQLQESPRTAAPAVAL